MACCSSTRTRLPALARIAAAARPPMPLPITTASSCSGTRLAEKTAAEREEGGREWASGGAQGGQRSPSAAQSSRAERPQPLPPARLTTKPSDVKRLKTTELCGGLLQTLTGRLGGDGAAQRNHSPTPSLQGSRGQSQGARARGHSTSRQNWIALFFLRFYFY